jgi:hypothetical protein
VLACAEAVESDPTGTGGGRARVKAAIDASIQRASVGLQGDVLEDELDLQNVRLAKDALDASAALVADEAACSEAARTAEEHLLNPIPRVVQLFFHEVQSSTNDVELLQKQLKAGCAWLVETLRAAGYSNSCKVAAKKLCGMRLFATHLGPSKELGPLQEKMRGWLEIVSRPLQTYYNDNADVRALGGLELLRHASLDGTRRQDADGLVPSLAHPDAQKNTFWNNRIEGREDGERVMIHVYRILAKLLTPRFDALGAAAVNHAAAGNANVRSNCVFRNPGCKGVARMLNKMKASDDHRYLERPRPAANIDILRAAVAVPTPQALAAAAQFVSSHASVAGVSRIKNGLGLDSEAAARQYHYRAVLVNFPFAPPGLTYGSLLGEELATRVLRDYRAKPDTDTQPWARWQNDVSRAIAHLRSDPLRDVQVAMICEMQFMLTRYLEGRKQSHLPYKVVRADDQLALWQDFRKDRGRLGSTLELDLAARLKLFEVASSGSPPPPPPPKEEEEEEEEGKAAPEAAATLRSGVVGYSAGEGDLDLLTCGLDAGISPNETAQGNGRATPLILACQNNHADVVRKLCQADGIDFSLARADGFTALDAAACGGHEECVLALLLAGVKPSLKAVEMATQRGHRDVVELLQSFVAEKGQISSDDIMRRKN